MGAKPADGTHRFFTRLERHRFHYAVPIPARISAMIARRGPVPVIAVVNDIAEVRASLTPAGGGRHQLRLNATTRKLAEISEGDRIELELRVDDDPTADPIPDDLRRALLEHQALSTFQRYPVGKQNHILQYIEAAAKEATREKRIAQTVEWTLKKLEKAQDRSRT